ncbi:FAD-dependent monooxygenase [Marivibrio halodurans]|uniref:FAD-dependent monooxygenase n=1 Tax=Marivibrio halodurans TaxID=2039722 RepID=A0A8J7V3H0_9PROT|nr:FAD-dependent monooxygenase [Marivibrio halodurans]
MAAKGDIRADGVVVVGAGIAGLTAAVVLGRAGVPVTLVERDAEMRGGGFLVSLSGEAHAVADRLGILDDVTARIHRITRSSYHDARGRRLLALDYGRLFGSLPVIQPMRNDLAKALMAALPDGVALHRGVTVTALDREETGIRLKLNDGSALRAAAVIGADGVHSATRALAFDGLAGHAPIRHDLGLFCAAYRLPNALGLDREFRTYMERARYMAIFQTASGDTKPEAAGAGEAETGEAGAVFVWAETAPAPPEEPAARADLLARAFTGAPKATATALAHGPRGRSFYMDRLSQIELPHWHAGRVALVGDAAHCLTLFSGRGAAAALTGAARLANAMLARPEDPAAAFAAVEGARKPILDAMQRATRAAVKWYVPRSAVIEAARNNAMRFLPRVAFERHFRAKYDSV